MPFQANSVVVPSVNVDQMKLLDHIAEHETKISVHSMTENDGHVIALLVLRLLKGRGAEEKQGEGLSICILAGKGGNGAGAVCAGRHLLNRGVLGLTVHVFWSCASSDLTPNTAHQRMGFLNSRGFEDEWAPDIAKTFAPTLIIDGLLGYNIRGKPRQPEEEMINWANGLRKQRKCVTVAVDIPSGFDSTSGETPGACILADHTLCLGLPKVGLLLNPGPGGQVWLGDVGIPLRAYEYETIQLTPPYKPPYNGDYIVALLDNAKVSASTL
jgi:NAD(P)H-hydrate epimerase